VLESRSSKDQRGGRKLAVPNLTDTIIDDLAPDLSMDTSYYRRDTDKLYLSGYEIASLIATGIVTSFIFGVYKGVKDKVGALGERFGAHVTEQVIDGLMKIRDRLNGLHSEGSMDILPRIQNVRNDLDLLVPVGDIQHLLNIDRDNEQTITIELEEVKTYLERIGYPDYLVSDRAKELVVRLRREFTRPTFPS
jgi:hypothetical protein